MTKKVQIGLVQINNSFSGQNYLPYSIACLQSYAEQNLTKRERFSFLPFIYKRLPISDIVKNLTKADIIGFSTYVWNSKISLEVARRLKEQRPEVLIIFGGPHVPDEPEGFLRENKFVDIVVHNEGEQTFLSILEEYPANNWLDLTGISYLSSNANFISTPATKRLRDIDRLPSPFLNGIFDELIDTHPEEQWIGLWETNRGCPFQCTFCDWGSATASNLTKFNFDRLKNELDWFALNKINYIFVCDANFGIQKRDVEIAEYVATIRSKTGFPQGFSVQNTKNATERAYLCQKILSDAGLNKGVALSMQTLDRTTLKNIKRDNISLDTYFELARRFTADKVETYSDLILGLPGETYDSFCNGVDQLIMNGQHNRIQFNNLSILPNAEMGNKKYLEKYGMITVESKIINIHGHLIDNYDDVQEFQQLVIATASMPKEQWRAVRTFSWMVAFLYFDKLLQMPLMVAHELSKNSYRSLIEAFIRLPKIQPNEFPVLYEIINFFEEEALSIQRGGNEYVYSQDWLGIYWPADEYIFIKLTVESKLDSFYLESSKLINQFCAFSKNEEQKIVDESLNLNSKMVSKPFAPNDILLQLNYNIFEFTKALREGHRIKLSKAATALKINREQSYYGDLNSWCREIVWWGNKKGAYLYPGEYREIEPLLSGHY